MIKKIIKVDELETGNIFYMEELPSFDMNEDQLGDDWAETGDDMILIVDSIEELDDYIGVYVNGGYFFELDKGTEVYLLGTYGDLLSELRTLKGEKK